MSNPPPNFDMRRISLNDVRPLCEQYHGYKSAGGTATYCFGVFENDTIVAAYAWQPPPPGAAKSVCPRAPHGVLSLSRMVAVPRQQRRLNHVSRPLRKQMNVIDRTRWPVLVTYSDEGQGHTGHVYKCSGWVPTIREQRGYYTDDSGARTSNYCNGKTGGKTLTKAGYTFLQRWEHRVCPSGTELEWMTRHGWRRVPIPGKVWRSGNQAFTYIKDKS